MYEIKFLYEVAALEIQMLKLNKDPSRMKEIF
jgi:hypothetical protein